MRILIPSLSRTNIVYTFGDDDYSVRMAMDTLSDRILEYDTLGDGMTQHTSTSCVRWDQFVDWGESVVHYLATDASRETEEAIYDIIKRCFWGSLSHSRVLAASKIKYIEGKRRYYEEHTFKVSAAASKAHDRRWVEITTYTNENSSALAGLLECYRGHFLHAYTQVERLREICSELNLQWVSQLPGLVEWMNTTPDWERDAHSVWYALHAFYKIHMHREDFKRAANNCSLQREQRLPEPADDKVASEA